jgi:rhamnosyltransferase
VIVRTRNSAATVGRVITHLRTQTISSEVIVVDSGSTDGTLALAHRGADQVIEIAAEDFSFGRALNVGASAASAPIHFALSSHAFPPDERWIERSLALYERADVAGTTGAPTPPDSREPLAEAHYQSLSEAIRWPWWGFSNTGASWRAEVWSRFPFDETLPTCEDKEWGLRVLAAGWTIAVDPRLCICDVHRRHHGVRRLFVRTRREFEAIRQFSSPPSLSFGDLVHEWLLELPANGIYRRWRRRLNYYRLAELSAKYWALRASGHPISRGARDWQGGEGPADAREARRRA